MLLPPPTTPCWEGAILSHLVTLRSKAPFSGSTLYCHLLFSRKGPIHRKIFSACHQCLLGLIDCLITSTTNLLLVGHMVTRSFSLGHLVSPGFSLGHLVTHGWSLGDSKHLLPSLSCLLHASPTLHSPRLQFHSWTITTGAHSSPFLNISCNPHSPQFPWFQIFTCTVPVSSFHCF